MYNLYGVQDRRVRSMLRKTVSEARKDLPEIFNKVCYAGERAIIQKHGKDCIAVIPVADLEILEYIENLIDIHEAETALKEAEKTGDIRPFKDFLKESGLDKL